MEFPQGLAWAQPVKYDISMTYECNQNVILIALTPVGVKQTNRYDSASSALNKTIGCANWCVGTRAHRSHSVEEKSFQRSLLNPSNAMDQS